MPFSEIYSAPLVVLSIATAIISSFAAFGIAERSASSPLNIYKASWVLFGALSIGTGVWAMHFIGMLALELPIAVFYDAGITVLSIIPAIFASGIALWMMSQKSHTHKQILINGFLLGSGIGLMHHSGMMAMRMDAVMVHDKFISLLSVLFAVTAATIALKIQVNAAVSDRDQFISKRKIISATIMGFAISGMHYTAMAGVDFIPKENSGVVQGIDSNGLAIMVSTAVFSIIIVSLFTPLLLRYKQATKELALIIAKEEKTFNLLHFANRAANLGHYVTNIADETWTNDTLFDEIFGIGSNFPRDFTAWQELIYPDDRGLVAGCFNNAIEANNQFPAIEYRIVRPSDGKLRWIKAQGYNVRDKNGLITKQVGLVQDVTTQKESVEKLKLLARVFSDTHEGISITEPDGTIINVNPAFCDITGYSREEVIGQNPRMLSSEKQGPQFYAEMWQSLAENGYWQGEVWNRNKNGTLYAELLTISALNDDNGKTVNYLGIFTDITHTKEQQKELELMAHYDVLTKLPNRVLFYDRFLQALAHSKRAKTMLAVCFLDLDNFKPVNDTFGHNVGDQLLIEVAERIKRNIREEDTVSRQGGDEFTLLLGELNSFAPCEKMLKRMLETLSKPYFIEGETITISASLGVTLYPQDNGDIDTLIRHADQAMYQAKLAGKNRYHLFNPEAEQQVSLKHQQLDEIERALSNNEFALYYQPKVNLKSGEVYGAEALIRWLHPEKGLIPPLDFLPVIEETFLEIQIGEWVIKQALAQAARWKKEGLSLEISVNIASYHLQSNTFFSQLEQALSKQPMVNPSNLQLEILESSALGDMQVITSIIESCQKTLGVKVALDDFGTGYSSLTHLRNLPAETIKIDQTFVRDMLDDPNDYTIIDGIIGLANSFGRNVIAEGVETDEHGLMLLMMGCHHAQGYGIARPMPAEQLSGWLSSYQPNAKWMELASTDQTKKSRLIQILHLAINQWAKRLETSLQSSPEALHSWPIMEMKKCFCGAWVEQDKHQQLFKTAWLDEIEKIHNKMHSLANELKKAHQEGRPEAAVEGLPAINVELEKIEKLLKIG